jgi:hypothetical protein
VNRKNRRSSKWLRAIIARAISSRRKLRLLTQTLKVYA